MDFTSSPYCKIPRYLLKCIGRWPYQNSSYSVIQKYIILSFVSYAVSTQVLRLVTSTDDLDLIIATIPPFVTGLTCMMKFITLLLYNNKLMNLQARLNEDWKALEDKEEIKIMERYLKEGKLYTTAYMIYMIATATIFILLIFETHILDIFVPLNESRPLKTVYEAEYYFFKAQDYFFYVTCHMVVSTGIVVTILIASDTMFIMSLQYICGMFAIVGYRLKCTLYKQDYIWETSTARKNKLYRNYIVRCVSSHRKALESINIIESIFSLSYLIQLFMNVICMSVTLVQVVVLLGKLEVIRYVLYAIGQLFHLFCTSYVGQKLIDHSTGVSNKLYSGLWYSTPVETQKMLLFMLRKFSVPSYLTAGKVFIFSMESFSMVVHNCMSYFMMLASFR